MRTRRWMVLAALLAAGCAQDSDDGKGGPGDAAPDDAGPGDAGPDPGTFAQRLAACEAGGFWRVDYDPTDEAARNAGWKLSDVLHLTPAGVTVDAYQAGECDAPPVVDAGWVGDAGCTLRVQRTTGPCGGGGYRSSLDLTVTLGGSSGGGQATFGEAPAGEPLPEGSFAVTAERHPADEACAALDPEPAQPGIFGDWAVEGAAQLTGEVVVDAVEIDDETQWVTVHLADGADPIKVPLSPDHPAPPAVGDTLWLDGETDMPFWVEGAYVLRAAVDGPLVAAGITGSTQWLDKGPWIRAGLTLASAAACAPAWLSLDCGELATFYRVSVGAPDARALSAGIGESRTIEAPTLGGPLELQVRNATTYDQVQCTDHPGAWFNLVLQPAAE